MSKHLSPSDASHNDIDEEMSNVMWAMTRRETDTASRYHAEHP